MPLKGQLFPRFLKRDNVIGNLGLRRRCDAQGLVDAGKSCNTCSEDPADPSELSSGSLILPIQQIIRQRAQRVAMFAERF